jgi:hypothetical protein
MRILFAIFFILTPILSSCATHLENPYPSQITDSSLRQSKLDPLLKANQDRWAHRDKLESLKAFIDSQKVILKSPARRDKDFVLMARAYFLLGEYFSESTNRKIESFAEAANWSEMALLQNTEYSRAQIGAHPEKAFSLLRKKNMESLYWHATALSKWADLKGVGTALKYRNRIQSMMERVNQLRPDYFFGGAHRFFGSYFGHLPGINEEDLTLSRKHFELALRAGPEFFGNHVSFAQIYGKKVDNPALIKKHLEVASRGDAGKFPDFAPEQMLEQSRAKKLLKGETP